ncbi:MAG TPA: PASTA domain-containing protein [Propionicimonas sp.]|nr:PASTA domain-containing protein [Propionicimonas sp.]
MAVKVLHPHLCATQQARSAFLREAQRAGQLRHPNIVAVRGSGLHDGAGVIMAWIALDHAEGPTLAEWVEAAGPLPPVAAAAVVRGVLAGLAEAHKTGLVHRDVSPRNVILEGAGAPGPRDLEPAMVRILDFGLADLSGRTTVGTDLLLSDAEDGEDGAVAGVVGNPEFISPEQARGRAVTAAGDLYQTGALLYFLLTGQAPYPRATSAQVLEAHITAPPPVPSALVVAARPLDRVVTRAMAKEPEDRFPDAAAFGEALVGALSWVGFTQLHSGVAAPYTPTRVMAVAVRPGLSGVAPARQLGGNRTEAVPRNPAAIIAVAAIVGVALLAVLNTFAAPAMSAHPPQSVLPPTTEATSARPTPRPTKASLSAAVTVPTLHGKLATAERALRAAGLLLGRVSRDESAEPAGTVLGQSPEAGQVVARGAAVNLQVASGANSVPATAGLTAAAAVATLQSAGFGAATYRDVLDATATVLRTEPVEGTVLRLGVTVTLILDGDPTPSPTTTPTPTTTASAP